MQSLAEIEDAILSLDDSDFDALRRWLDEQEADRWDEQMARDAKAGKFKWLMDEARAEREAGLTEPL